VLNQRRSLDFVHDQIATRRPFRIFDIVADVTRECLRAVQPWYKRHRASRRYTRTRSARAPVWLPYMLAERFCYTTP